MYISPRLNRSLSEILMERVQPKLRQYTTGQIYSIRKKSSLGHHVSASINQNWTELTAYCLWALKSLLFLKQLENSGWGGRVMFLIKLKFSFDKNFKKYVQHLLENKSFIFNELSYLILFLTIFLLLLDLLRSMLIKKLFSSTVLN